MARADLVVAMAGYNTTAEILHLGRPALLVPRSGPSAEQRMRAERFAERGWVRWLPPEALPHDGLAGAIVDAFEAQPAEAPSRPDLRGRSNAVERLLALADVGSHSSGFAATSAAAVSGPVA
jgi:predicted glycosyltransferase